MELTGFDLRKLPPDFNFETHTILKSLSVAHRYLAELKGTATTIPNENILIQTLALQEAKDSSEIENIVTTHDDLFKAQLPNETSNPAAKEVSRYVAALKVGFESVRATKLITNNQILKIQSTLEKNDAGFRKLPGTALRNLGTGEIIYTPPQDPAVIQELMTDLESFINDPSRLNIDPLIKMAIIHYQFESIHPFYDGNGRTGRIINILYLVANGLLNLPILYLSRYLIQGKETYYTLLQKVRTDNAWEEWVLFILNGITLVSIQSLVLITEIRLLMKDYKHRIRAEFPKFYSQDLLNNLFRHPYTKISVLQNELDISRLTANRYLDALANAGYLQKRRMGKSNYYINTELIKLLLNLPSLKKGSD